jgi:hypothetical protein
MDFLSNQDISWNFLVFWSELSLIITILLLGHDSILASDGVLELLHFLLEDFWATKICKKTPPIEIFPWSLSILLYLLL